MFQLAALKNDPWLVKLLERVRRMACALGRRLPSSVQLDDLIAAGNLGVATALAHHKGAPQSVDAYAMAHARGAMIDELRRVDRMSRAGRRNARRAHAAALALSSELGRAPEEAEIAAALEMDVSAYRELVRQMASVAVEAETRDGRGNEGEIVVPDEFAPMEERIDTERARRFVASQIAGLPPRHAAVITLSFEEERTLRSIAEELGVSTARAGQLRQAAIERLRRAYVANDAGHQGAVA